MRNFGLTDGALQRVQAAREKHALWTDYIDRWSTDDPEILNEDVAASVGMIKQIAKGDDEKVIRILMDLYDVSDQEAERMLASV